MVVEIDEGSDLSTSRKRPGSKSLLTRDSDGKLGQATVRELTDAELEDLEPEPEVVFVVAEPPPRSKEEQEFIDTMVAVINHVIDVHVAPRVGRLIETKVKPALKRQTAAAKQKLGGSRANVPPPAIAAAPKGAAGRELEAAAVNYRINMSSAEAQARYLVALAARAYSDEQMQLLLNADIEDAEEFAALTHALSELPPEDVAKLLDAVRTNPLVLDGELLVQLRRLLGLEQVVLGTVPVDRWAPSPPAIPERPV